MSQCITFLLSMNLFDFDWQLPINITSACVIEFWHLKPGFRRILSSTVRKCTRKVCFYKPCTWAVLESEFNHANRFRALKSRQASLYSVQVIEMSRLTIDRFLILWSRHGSLYCCAADNETEYTTVLSLDTQDVERG